MAILEDGNSIPFAPIAVEQTEVEGGRRGESEAQLRDLLATLDLGAFMARDFGGTIRFWSAGCERLYGWTTAEAVGQITHELLRTVHPVPLAEIEAILERDGEWTGDLRHRTRSGAEIIVTAHKALRRGPDGRPVAVLESLTDVTAQRRAEAALAASEARLRAVVETTPDCIKLVGPDGTLLQMNRAGLHLAEADGPEEVEGRSVFDLIAPEHRAEWRAKHERVCRGEALNWEFDLIGLRGTRRRMETRAAPLLLPDGRLAHLAVTRDVTERHRAEEALRESQAETERQRRLYEAILTNTPDLAYVFDLDHRFTYANEVLLRMWGKTREEAIGRNCLELGYEPWHAAMHDREIEQVVATRQPIRGEVPFTGTFGRRIYDYIFVPVIGPDGEVEAVAGTTRDVTDRKQAEEQRLLLAREVDHRAKNALTVVQALLRLTPAEDEATRHFAASVTGRVAAMARAHALLSQERWAGAELRALAEEELAPFAPGEPDRVRLDGPSLRLASDAAQSFSMVLHELATNAAKYGALSAPGGCLELRWRIEEGGTLVLCWTETGGPPPVAPPARGGFGSRLVESSLRQIGGSVHFDWQPAGLRCTLRVPVDRLSAAAAAG